MIQDLFMHRQRAHPALPRVDWHRWISALAEWRQRLCRARLHPYVPGDIRELIEGMLFTAGLMGLVFVMLFL